MTGCLRELSKRCYKSAFDALDKGSFTIVQKKIME